jgi:hypothetical protein
MTYGPAQQNAFFQGVVAAAEAQAKEWGVADPNDLINDFLSNALACLLVEATDAEFATLMSVAQNKAEAVLRTRDLRETINGR